MSDFSKVGDFHRKFGLPSVLTRPDGSTCRNALTGAPLTSPRHISRELQQFRLKFLREELKELDEAYAEENLAEIADALVDIVYVALGTAHMHGLPWQELFDAVQESNMMKVRCGIDHKYELACCDEPEWKHSKRGSSADVIKPPDWKAPDLAGVLEDWE